MVISLYRMITLIIRLMSLSSDMVSVYLVKTYFFQLGKIHIQIYTSYRM